MQTTRLPGAYQSNSWQGYLRPVRGSVRELRSKERESSLTGLWPTAHSQILVDVLAPLPKIRRSKTRSVSSVPRQRISPQRTWGELCKGEADFATATSSLRGGLQS